jgi:hypothetical protein
VCEIPPTRTAYVQANNQASPSIIVHVGDPAGLFRCAQNHEFECELYLACLTWREA